MVPILILILRSLRYSDTNTGSWPLRPILWRSRMIPYCQVVSKAFSKSKKRPTASCLCAKASRRYLLRLTRWSVMLQCFLKPHWLLSSILYFSRYQMKWVLIMRSRTLHRQLEDWWRRYSDRRPGSYGTPGLIHPPVSLDWTPGSSGWSLGISGSRCLNCGSVLGVWNWHHHIHTTLHQCHHWHKVEKAGLVDPSQKGWEKQTAILRNHGSILSFLIWCWDLAGVVPTGVPWATAPAELSTPAKSWSSAESATSAESAVPVTPAKSSSAGLGGDWITVIVLFSGGSGTAGDSITSSLEIWDDPDWSLSTFSRLTWWCCLGRDLRSTNARDEEGRDLWSTDALGWWWWVEEGRTSVALPEARLDSGRSVESTYLDRHDEDEGRVRSPLSWCLGEWRALGDSWRLSDTRRWSLWPHSPLCDLWRSDPLVPEGPSDREDRSTTDSLYETVLLDFLSRDLEGRSSIAFDVWDEVAVFALFQSCCRDDPSSLFLTGGDCSLSSGVWSSIESSMVSWALLAAAAAVRFCFCLNALSNVCQASGSQSLQTSHGDSWVQSVKPSLRRHCWHLWWLSLCLLKWEQPGNYSCGSVDEEWSHDSAILLCCQKRATFHTSQNKVKFKANATSKAR